MIFPQAKVLSSHFAPVGMRAWRSTVEGPWIQLIMADQVAAMARVGSARDSAPGVFEGCAGPAD